MELLFASYCSARLVIEKQTHSGRMISYVGGTRRHQQEIKIGCTYRPLVRPHTRFLIKKKVRKITLWDGWRRRRRRKKLTTRRDKRLPYTMQYAHSCCPPNFFWFLCLFICDLSLFLFLVRLQHALLRLLSTFDWKVIANERSFKDDFFQLQQSFDGEKVSFYYIKKKFRQTSHKWNKNT